MTKLTAILILVTFIISCKNEQSKFVYDNYKTSQDIRYSYVTKNEHKISMNEKSYIIMTGNVVDSMITTTNYEYDGKGRLIKESRKTDFEDKPELQLYEYNSNDSLITELTINTEGDTTFVEKYNYYIDGRKTVFQRILWEHLDENQDLTHITTKKQYDTILYKNEFVYAGGLCKGKIEYDKGDAPVKEIRYEYQDQQLIKETYITINQGKKLIEKIRYFNYNKSKTKPDFFCLDSKKDTVEKSTNEFENEILISTISLYDYGNITSNEYYHKGRLIGFISIDKKMNFKTTHSYHYNGKGYLVQEMSYNEKLK